MNSAALFDPVTFFLRLPALQQTEGDFFGTEGITYFRRDTNVILSIVEESHDTVVILSIVEESHETVVILSVVEESHETGVILSIVEESHGRTI